MAFSRPPGFPRPSINEQEDWPVELSDLAPAFDSLDILNLNDDFGQQNQNVELALHGIDKSDQFRTALNPSYNRLQAQTQWHSIQTAPALHAKQTPIHGHLTYQSDHHMQNGQTLGSSDTSAFMFSVPHAFDGNQDLQGADWITPESSSQIYCENPLNVFPNQRKRAQGTGIESAAESLEKSPTDEMPRTPIGKCDRANAVSFIKSWLSTYPEIFPKAKQINALAELCRLPPSSVETLLNQILREQPLEKTNVRDYIQEEPRAKRKKTQSRPGLQQQPSARDVNATNLQDVASWVKDRTPSCHPVLELKLLHRDRSRIYQCTLLCGKAFKRKGDWKRHEEQNYPQEGWICDLDATAVVGGIMTCSYCKAQDPEASHVTKIHQKGSAIIPCKDKPLDARGRISYRKEHFLNHFEHIHPSIPSENYVALNHFLVDSNFPRRCGFCNKYDFRHWQDRIEHISSHFESGQDVSVWRQPKNGGRDYDKDDCGDGSPPEGESGDQLGGREGSSDRFDALCRTRNGGHCNGHSSSSASLDDNDGILPNMSSSRESGPNVEQLRAGGPLGQSTEPDFKLKIEDTTEMPKSSTSIALSAFIEPNATVKDTNNSQYSSSPQRDISKLKGAKSTDSPTALRKPLRLLAVRKNILQNDNATSVDVADPFLAVQFRGHSPQFGNSGWCDTPGLGRSSESTDSSTLQSSNHSIGKIPGRKRVGCRLGPLSPEIAKGAALMRKVRTCWPCRISKVRCSFGDPCIRCSMSSVSPFAHRLCIRRPFEDFHELFFPGVLASYLTNQEIERLVSKHCSGFKGSKISFTVTCGPSLPPMTFETNIFELNTDSLLDANCIDVGTQKEGDHTPQNAAPISILGTYVPDLKEKCKTLIESMISEVDYALWLSPEDSSKLSKDVLEAVRKLSMEKSIKINGLLRTALKLYAMHHFINQNMTINHTTVDNSSEDSHSTSGPPISSLSLSRQVKYAVLTLMREDTRSVLRGLEREMLSHEPSWLVSFSVILILCLCVEEIPSTISSANDSFPPRDDLERETFNGKKFYTDLKNHPFRIITAFFRNRCPIRLNPYGTEPILGSKYSWSDEEADFVREIGQIIANHKIGRLDHQSLSVSDDSMLDAKVNTQQWQVENAGQLLWNFLGSFISDDKSSTAL